MRIIKIANNVWLQYAVLLAGVLCIAWSAIFVKLADVSGFASAFYRMFIASVAILPLFLRRQKRGIDLPTIKGAALCGLFFACDIAIWNTSILLSKAAISTLLANLAPIWVGLGALFILKEKPKPIYWIGTFIAIAGVIIIIGISNVYHTRMNLGNTLAICASVFYAAYLLTTQKVRLSIDTVSFTAISMFASTFVLFFICLVSGTQLTGYSAKSWLALAGVGLISQLGGWLAINYALGYIRSTAASVSLLSQSVFTALIAVPVLGEYLSWVEMSGAIIVLIGIYMVNRVHFKQKTKVEPEYD
jgi:drug/metabolite transporter (DMT)-like permease